MAVTTFEDFYTLVRNNVVYFQYQKGDIELNIKGTLIRDLIPGSDDDLQRYDVAIKLSDYHLGQWIGSDSDESNILHYIENSNSVNKIPEWLKIYSINYNMWINIEIAKINSLQVVDS
jgi:hypothetical protein